jgi:RNA polymerase sigma factor (sigma-70 family)
MEPNLTREELNVAIQELIPVLKSRASSFIKSKEEADDLFQETFVKIWANTDKFIYNESLKAWCFKIMYNTFVDMFKENKKKTFLEEGDKPDSLNINTLFKRNFKELGLIEYNEAENNIITDDIMQTIDSVLSPIDALIVKRKLTGFKQEEIAKELGLKKNNVKQHYFQAIRKVRKELASKFNLDDNYGCNTSLVETHKVYRRRQLDREEVYRKKFK